MVAANGLCYEVFQGLWINFQSLGMGCLSHTSSCVVLCKMGGWWLIQSCTSVGGRRGLQAGGEESLCVESRENVKKLFRRPAPTSQHKTRHSNY